MEITSLVLTTVLVTASGALAPGPLTVSTIAVGVKGGWKAGLQVALGHMMFELPYIILLALAYETIRTQIIENVTIKYLFTLFISLFIVYFSILLIRDAFKAKSESVTFNTTSSIMFKNPIVVGVALTGLNPYFLLWWLTIGLPLISYSINLGLIGGLAIIYTSHVWMDFVWLTTIAHISMGSTKLLGSKGYRGLLIALAFILILFMLDIMFRSFLNYKIIPL